MTYRFTVNFHGLGEPHAGVQEAEAPYWCPEDEFGRFLDAIVDLRSDPDTPAEIAITMDDGNRSDLSIAVPALIERGLTATFFVCSGRLDDPLYLDPDDLLTMRSRGMAIGCHGATHVSLRGLDAKTLRAETVAAKAALSAVLSDRVSSFAIPFGLYDRHVLAALDSFDEIHTSDRQVCRSGARVVTRHSYLAGWTVDDFLHDVRNLPTGLAALVGRTKLFIKRTRP